jgi:enamine deaminase RidA (YjgF/YER057c/UK114 family)
LNIRPWRRFPDDTAEAGKLVNLRSGNPSRLSRKEAMGYHSRASETGSSSMPIKRIEAGPRMSQAVVHGNVVYLAGQVAADPVPSVGEQTKQILATIDTLLKAVGTDKSKLLSAQIFLADIGRFAEMNAVWDAWVSPGNTPARATIQAALARPQLLVEIMVTAATD